MLAASEVRVGAQFTQVVVEDLKRTQIVQYAGASGDYNPLHTDEPYAQKVGGYPTVFAHGMLTMGISARVLTDTFGVGNLTRYSGRFTSQVWPGDTLTTIATVDEILPHPGDEGGWLAEIRLTTVNQDGTEVFSGKASARLSP